MLQLQFKQENISNVDLGQQERLTIGRDKSNDIVLDDPDVSGNHAEIRKEGSSFFLVEMGSTNGTFVNGQKVSGRQEIKAWNTVSFAKIEAEVVDTERPRPTQVSRAISDEELGVSGQDQSSGQWVLEGSSGKVKGKSYSVSGKMVIGREESCDIHIDSEMVSKQHAELALNEGVLELKDLGSTNGSFVNGSKIQATFLKSGDEIKFDQETFWVKGLAREDKSKTQVRQAVGSDATQVRSAVGSEDSTQTSASGSASKAAAAKLLLQKGNLDKQSFDLSKQSMILGRDSACDICLSDDTVTSRHASLNYTDNGWEIKDLGSSNGTFVNGKKVTSKTLQHRDKVALGQIELQFEDSGAAAKSGTRIVSSQQAGDSASSTRTMAAAQGDSEKTGAKTSVWAKLPGWAYALIGFGVVLLALGVFLFLQNTNLGGSRMLEAKLQGGKVWTQQLPGKRKAPSTPALTDVNNDDFLDVIIPDSSGYILALDGEKGKMIFQAEVGNRIMAPVAFGDFNGDATSDVLVSSNTGIVSAMNGKGQFLWQSSGELGLKSIINSPVLSHLNDDEIKDVVLPTAGKGLVALDGARSWKMWDTAGMCQGKMITSPVKADLNNDGLGDFVGVTNKGEVLAVTSQKEKVWQLWKTDLEDIYYASPLYIPSETGGLVVVATDKSGIVALNGKSGRMAWISENSKRFFSSPVAADANRDGVKDVVAISLDGVIHVLNGKNGDVIWKQSLDVNIQATPALYDVNQDGLQDLIIPDTAGNILVVDMQRGRVQLELDVSGADSFVASPVMGDVDNDGLMDILVAAKNGRIATYGINRKAEQGNAYWPRFLGNDQHIAK